jgi:hypothetical protein
MTDPGPLQHTEDTPRGDRATMRRWTRWQRTPVARRYLTRDAAAQGYTLVQVAPQSTATFFACVALLQAQARGASPDEPTVQAAWQAWESWTRRLAAYLERVATGREGTLPPVPEALLTLLDAQEVGDG